MNRSTLTVMIDALAAILLVFVLLPHNPEYNDQSPTPGNIAVEIRWPDGWDTDVDLWCRGPDGKPVGYSSRSSRTMNLLRDDLGIVSDLGGLNYEHCFSRGLAEGEYVVNVHLFRNAQGIYPVEVHVSVSVRLRGGNVEGIDTRTVRLSYPGQEITVVRFSIDASGLPMTGSVHDTPVALRQGRSVP